MNTTGMVGIIGFFIAIVANRFIMSAALRRLDDQTKLKLIDIFSRRSTLSNIILLAIVIGCFGALQAHPEWGLKFTFGYLAVFLVYLAVKIFLNYRKLREIGAPSSYINSFFAGYGIFIIGFLAMVFLLSWSALF
jgi:small-conductance mechanosensitive channel